MLTRYQSVIIIPTVHAILPFISSENRIPLDTVFGVMFLFRYSNVDRNYTEEDAIARHLSLDALSA